MAIICADYLCLKCRLLLLNKSTEKWLFCFYKMDALISGVVYLNLFADYFKICGEHLVMYQIKFYSQSNLKLIGKKLL